MPVGRLISEVEMKRVFILTIATALVTGMCCWALAYETDFDDIHQFDRSLPAWKLGRGVVNVLSGPHEFFTAMTNNGIKGAYEGAYQSGLHGSIAGATNGVIAGFGGGMVSAFKRVTVGFLEMITFWKPEYGPTEDPTWGTRNLAFGKNDYFDSEEEPFWYMGPSR
jgi:hypothetical protein